MRNHEYMLNHGIMLSHAFWNHVFMLSRAYHG